MNENESSLISILNPKNNRDKDTEYDTEIDEKPGQKNEEHKSHYTKKNQEEYLEKLCPD